MIAMRKIWFVVVFSAVLLFGCLASTPVEKAAAGTPMATTAASTTAAVSPAPTVAPSLQAAEKGLAAFENSEVAVALNSEVYAGLVEAGIKDALVDVSPDRIVVGFTLPADVQKESALGYALGVAGGFQPDTKLVVVQLFNDGGRVAEQYEVAPDKIREAAEGKKGLAELLAESKVQAG